MVGNEGVEIQVARYLGMFKDDEGWDTTVRMEDRERSLAADGIASVGCETRNAHDIGSQVASWSVEVVKACLLSVAEAWKDPEMDQLKQSCVYKFDEGHGLASCKAMAYMSPSF